MQNEELRAGRLQSSECRMQMDTRGKSGKTNEECSDGDDETTDHGPRTCGVCRQVGISVQSTEWGLCRAELSGLVACGAGRGARLVVVAGANAAERQAKPRRRRGAGG